MKQVAHVAAQEDSFLKKKTIFTFISPTCSFFSNLWTMNIQFKYVNLNLYLENLYMKTIVIILN